MNQPLSNDIILDKFIKNISKLQQTNNSKFFTLYDKIYKKLFQRFFRLSSVSIIFRLSLNKQNLIKTASSRAGKLNYNSHYNEKLKDKIQIFEDDFKELIIKSNNESPIIYEGKQAFKINDLSFISNNINAKRLINHEKENLIKTDYSKSDYKDNLNGLREDLDFEELIKNLELEVLFVKRAKSNRDKYSGDIGFPGGRFEKEDYTTFNTSVRETFEEIGINLLANYNEESVNNDKIKNMSFISLYLGPNIGFDVTIDMKNFVSSHLFLIIDFNRELEEKFILSENEIAEVIFVPLNFFFGLDKLLCYQKEDKVENKIYTYVNGIVGGRKCKVKKIILNNNPNLLIYGMTLRKIISVLNMNSNNIRYNDEIFFESNALNFFYKMVLYLLKFMNNSSNSYRLFKRLIGFLSLFLFGKIIFKEIQNTQIGNSKF